MFDFPKWKYLVLLFVVVVSGLYALPNVFQPIPAVQLSGISPNKVSATLKGDVEGLLKGNKIPFQSVDLSKDRLLVKLASLETQAAANDLIRLDDKIAGKYNSALNLAPTAPDWLTKIGARAMTLGLDLRGGVHFLLQVDRASTQTRMRQRLVSALTSMMTRREISRSGSIDSDGELLDFKVLKREDVERTRKEIERTLPELELLKDDGDTRIAARIRPEEITRALQVAVEQNIATLRRRVNNLGVSEPLVQRQGLDRVVVQLPGVQDTSYAKKILGSTATLEYRGVDMSSNFNAVDIERSGNVPGDSAVFYRRGAEGERGDPVILKKEIIASGEDLENAVSGVGSDNGQPEVTVTLNGAAANRMIDFSSKNVGNLMAVVYRERIPTDRKVDDKIITTYVDKVEVISVATVQSTLGKVFRTTGLASEEAKELADSLRSGSLAAPMDIVEERVIGPSLGAKNIESGIKAILFSFLFVLVFFVIYYKMFGVISNIALVVNLLMVVALMSLFGATMTLPGLAGLALTVGMSVDANVLINERIREELRRGITPLQAIEIGYEKASGTIADANVTALLGGIALFAFGSGPIKGFALTLCLGILTSMYTAVSLSKAIAALIYSGRKVKSLSI
jgi:preprotein translocase subunit SecD